MVLNTKEAETNNVDWSTFEKAWNDNHLKEDSLYATSMSRWLDQFSLERFLIINSFDLKNRIADCRLVLHYQNLHLFHALILLQKNPPQGLKILFFF